MSVVLGIIMLMTGGFL